MTENGAHLSYKSLHRKILLPGIIMLSGLGAKAQTFSAGKQFQSSVLLGQVNVTCPGVKTTFQCKYSYLKPESTAFFIGPAGISADQVSLTVITENGDLKQSRIMPYDAVRSQSRERFNLWNSQMVQRPILAVGNNQVTFKLFLQGSEVRTGQFLVNVQRTGTVQCGTRDYFSQAPADCENQFTMCERYFLEQNYCQ